jgi:uncharacterized protein (TIGR03435 family)
MVVLEFWATWCGPCVQAIPHLNDLAEKFRKEPVQFVAITSEDEATVKAFLKKKPINAWVALDTDKAMNNAYGITAIPQTVVIGKDGKIAAITNPFELTEESMKDLLAGKPLITRGSSGGGMNGPGARSYGSMPPEIQKRMNELAGGSEPPLFQVLVRRAADTTAQYGFGGRGKGLASAGVTIREILPRAFGPFPDRILVQTPLPEGKYDFIINPGKGIETDSVLLLQQALKSAFGVKGRKLTQETNVLTLKVCNPKAIGLVASTTEAYSMRSAPGELNGVSMTMAEIARGLELRLNTPVADETGLTNRYDVNVTWTHYPVEIADRELVKAVREQLGLELKGAKRPVEMWVVEAQP